MANNFRKRMLEPFIWQCDEFEELNDRQKLLFIGLISMADENGAIKAHERLIKNHIFPFIKRNIGKDLDKLLTLNLLKGYNKGQNEYYFLPTWHSYQYIRSDLVPIINCPKPPNEAKKDEEVLPICIAPVTPTRRKRSSNISKDKISKDNSAFSFKKFWDLYDYKENSGDCEKIWNGQKQTKNGITLNDDLRKIIMVALPLYIENTFKNGDYPARKHPKTYLNNKGWENEVVIIKKKKKRYEYFGSEMVYSEDNVGKKTWWVKDGMKNFEGDEKDIKEVK